MPGARGQTPTLPTPRVDVVPLELPMGGGDMETLLTVIDGELASGEVLSIFLR